jgi:hypothetical protein
MAREMESKRRSAARIRHLVFDLARSDELAANRARLTAPRSAPNQRNRVLRQRALFDFFPRPSTQLSFRQVSLGEHGYSPE